VRTQPGGRDSISNLFGGESQDRFVPTRKYVTFGFGTLTPFILAGRVRQRPGGEDNIEGVSTRHDFIKLRVLIS
jgi:hypothetical protein